MLPTISDDTPFVPLQNIPTPATPASQAPKKIKEPMFVWRGKPIGAGKRDDAVAVAPARGKKNEQRAAVQTPADFDPSNTVNIDTRRWFEDSMSWAMDRNASDVHIVLDGKTGVLTARVRIDGIMRPFATIEGTDAASIMGIFKTAAEMHSISSFIPEESLYKIDVDGEVRTARAAMARDHSGGNALVLRLPSTGAVKRLEELGFSDENLATLKKMLRSANRMIIFAGPMGAGKTSTAHGALLEVATPGRSVWSIEDPVERNIPGVVQIEADEDNKAGFAELLPFLVRSDYDTLFLGEIRDKVTAAAGVRQAKAGRQVITTIHATDNIIALYRLIELAEDTPLSCMNAIRGIVSQRLLRRLNPDWSEGDNVDDKYKGRVPIHEVLIINDELIEAVMGDKPLGLVKDIAKRASTSTFTTDAQRLVDAGITDPEEVERVLGADSE
jgi:type II secretory ATPase GspE/PulE/Tfp pilus assembly ATPase PilB-like protein